MVCLFTIRQATCDLFDLCLINKLINNSREMGSLIISLMVICFAAGVISSYYLQKISNILKSNNMESSWMELYWSYEKFKVLIDRCTNECEKTIYKKVYKRALFWSKFSLILMLLFFIGCYTALVVISQSLNVCYIVPPEYPNIKPTHIFRTFAPSKTTDARRHPNIQPHSPRPSFNCEDTVNYYAQMREICGDMRDESPDGDLGHTPYRIGLQTCLP